MVFNIKDMNSYTRHMTDNGQRTQAISSGGVLKNINDLENLHREIPASLWKKKAEKLSTAVYLVTGFLSDNEPIKWQIRECALSVLSDVISITDSRVSETTHRVKSDIGKITALFEVAAVAGFLSEMNLSILKEEYRSLVQVIENRTIGNPEGGYVFSREFFSVSESAHPLPNGKESFTQDNFSKRHFKKEDADTLQDIKGHAVERITHTDKENDISDTTPKNTPAKRIEKSSRSETVLRLIKDKGDRAELSIKDIVGHISDCGEKTIQRELTALVEKGVLKKTGERRWSRYSLNI